MAGLAGAGAGTPPPPPRYDGICIEDATPEPGRPIAPDTGLATGCADAEGSCEPTPGRAPTGAVAPSGRAAELLYPVEPYPAEPYPAEP